MTLLSALDFRGLLRRLVPQFSGLEKLIDDGLGEPRKVRPVAAVVPTKGWSTPLVPELVHTFSRDVVDVVEL